ncbi:hypothetical protein [Streptomyces sp. NPDC004592]
MAVEEVDTSLAGGPDDVLTAETAAVDHDPGQAIDTRAARLPQRSGPAHSLVLACRSHGAERDVEFTTPAIPGVQARTPLPRGQIDYLPAITPQHPRSRHYQASIIEPSQLRGRVPTVAPADDRPAQVPACGPGSRQEDDTDHQADDTERAMKPHE